MPLPLNYSNTAVETALNDVDGINATDTSIVVDDGSTYPTAWYKIQMEDEVILISSRSGNTMTVSSTPDGRGWDGTTAATHADDTAVKLVASAEDMIQVPRNSVTDYLYRRPTDETAHNDDDEFDGSGLGGWTAVAIGGGTYTRTEDKHVLSSRASGGAANNFAGVLKSLGALTSPVTIETHLENFGTNTAGEGIVGVGFTDGTTGTSNCCFSLLWDGGSPAIRLDHGTLNNMDAGVNQSIVPGATSFRHGLFLRCIWKSANTFRIQFSLDGVSWSAGNTGDVSKTMTPTQFGLLHHAFNSAEDLLAYFDYFRVYEVDKSA